jgi:hypothetical protein
LDQLPSTFKVGEGITVQNLNTQAAEQRNSTLDRIQTQVDYFSHDNAVAYIKYFLGTLNNGVKKKLNEKGGGAS